MPRKKPVPTAENLLTKVARNVGSALGTIASRTTKLTATRTGSSDAGEAKDKKRQPKANSTKQRTSVKKQSKRAAHKRKLKRKSSG